MESDVRPSYGKFGGGVTRGKAFSGDANQRKGNLLSIWRHRAESRGGGGEFQEAPEGTSMSEVNHHNEKEIFHPAKDF